MAKNYKGQTTLDENFKNPIIINKQQQKTQSTGWHIWANVAQSFQTDPHEIPYFFSIFKIQIFKLKIFASYVQLCGRKTIQY